jgi:hypothetical protein
MEIEDIARAIHDQDQRNQRCVRNGEMQPWWWDDIVKFYGNKPSLYLNYVRKMAKEQMDLMVSG